jgi:hypothetical protein
MNLNGMNPAWALALSANFGSPEAWAAGKAIESKP